MLISSSLPQRFCNGRGFRPCNSIFTLKARRALLFKLKHLSHLGREFAHTLIKQNDKRSHGTEVYRGYTILLRQQTIQKPMSWAFQAQLDSKASGPKMTYKFHVPARQENIKYLIKYEKEENRWCTPKVRTRAYAQQAQQSTYMFAIDDVSTFRLTC